MPQDPLFENEKKKKRKTSTFCKIKDPTRFIETPQC